MCRAKEWEWRNAKWNIKHNQQIQYFIHVLLYIHFWWWFFCYSLSLSLSLGGPYCWHRLVFIYAFWFLARCVFHSRGIYFTFPFSHNVFVWLNVCVCRASAYIFSLARLLDVLANFHHVVEIHFWIHERGFSLFVCGCHFTLLFLFYICLFDCTYACVDVAAIAVAIGWPAFVVCCCFYYCTISVRLSPFLCFVNECIFNFNHFFNWNMNCKYKSHTNQWWCHCHWNTLLLHISRARCNFQPQL